MNNTEQSLFDENFASLFGFFRGIGVQEEIIGESGQLTDCCISKTEAKILAGYYLMKMNNFSFIYRQYEKTGSRGFHIKAFANRRLGEFIDAGAITGAWVEEQVKKIGDLPYFSNDEIKRE